MWYVVESKLLPGKAGLMDHVADVDGTIFRRWWPNEVGYVAVGWAVTMCDVFNTRDYGRTDPE